MAAPLRTLARMALPSFSSAFSMTAGPAFFSLTVTSGSSMMRNSHRPLSRF